MSTRHGLAETVIENLMSRLEGAGGLGATGKRRKQETQIN